MSPRSTQTSGENENEDEAKRDAVAWFRRFQGGQEEVVQEEVAHVDLGEATGREDRPVVKQD